MGDVIVIALLIGILGLSVRSLVKSKKQGGCCGNCDQCKNCQH